MHIYLEPDFDHLNDLLAEESLSLSNRQWQVRTGGVMHDNYWLIQLPNVTNVIDAGLLFQKSPLRFDSLAFSFHIKGKSLLIKIQYYFRINYIKYIVFLLNFKTTPLRFTIPTIFTSNPKLR